MNRGSEMRKKGVLGEASEGVTVCGVRFKDIFWSIFLYRKISKDRPGGIHFFETHYF